MYKPILKRFESFYLKIWWSWPPWGIGPCDDGKEIVQDSKINYTIEKWCDMKWWKYKVNSFNRSEVSDSGAKHFYNILSIYARGHFSWTVPYVFTLQCFLIIHVCINMAPTSIKLHSPHACPAYWPQHPSPIAASHTPQAPSLLPTSVETLDPARASACHRRFQP